MNAIGAAGALLSSLGPQLRELSSLRWELQELSYLRWLSPLRWGRRRDLLQQEEERELNPEP